MGQGCSLRATQSAAARALPADPGANHALHRSGQTRLRCEQGLGMSSGKGKACHGGGRSRCVPDVGSTSAKGGKFQGKDFGSIQSYSCSRYWRCLSGSWLRTY